MEYLIPHRGARGQSFVYELAYELDPESESCLLPGLIDPAECSYDGNLPGLRVNLPGPIRPQSGGCRGDAGVASARVHAALSSSLAAKEEKNAHLGHINSGVVVVAASGAAEPRAQKAGD